MTVKTEATDVALSIEDEPVSVTVKVACARIGISKSTFYKEVRIGNFVLKKNGRQTLVPYDQVKKWVKALPDHKL